MNPLKSNNIVAKILQVYAYINAIAGVILAIFAASELNVLVAIVVFAVVLVASFFVYALGESSIYCIKSSVIPAASHKMMQTMNSPNCKEDKGNERTVFKAVCPV